MANSLLDNLKLPFNTLAHMARDAWAAGKVLC